jgi:hypothetical protein
MHIINATSPADAWVKGTEYLLEHGHWIHSLSEILKTLVLLYLTSCLDKYLGTRELTMLLP